MASPSRSSTTAPFPSATSATTFATVAPQLAAEKAHATDLFGAFETLRGRVAAWAARLALEHDGDPSPTTDVASPTPTSPAPTPVVAPWLDHELEGFFATALAPAIQARESRLVNELHACARQELARRDQRVAALERELGARQELWQSKLDRRVAETNALRKEFYKQLLLLRELVAKQRSDPRTLRALEDVIATAMPAHAGDGASKTLGPTWVAPQATRAPNTSTSAAVAMGSAALRKEKEKWEERAREAATECQQLQEQVLVLKQQLEEARGLDGELWFATAQHGLYERQRILDSVYRSKCSWEQVGESILELLNNEVVWAAVEDSAFREKTRVSRGLEALLLRADAVGGGSRKGSLVDNDLDGIDDLDTTEEGGERAARARARRRDSAVKEGSRMIMCRTCNGCGYLDPSAVTSSALAGAGEPEDDSYLRKTLAQVLELKTALEEANSRTNQVEQQLLRTVMEGAQVKERLEKIEFTRAHSIDSALQTDLDDEEEIDVDAIMNAYTNASDEGGTETGGERRRRGGRWKQYEHLIVELKSLLTERDGAIAQLRTAVADAQTRLVSVQKVSQQEQDRLQRELQTLKGSLALAMNNRNEVIEEKQAAVNMLLKTMDRKKSQALSSKSFLLPRPARIEVDAADDGGASVDSNNDSLEDLEDVDDDIDEEDEVKRSEMIARRYSQAIGRVQKEHEEQQQRLKLAEDELGQESDKRKRTNSIMLGNMAVTMTSHPRDLFKALTTTHQELLNFRRSSQRSSALQTDRLLTLTTHLAHISEELVMVKKRTSAEIEFWKLDCEKLQNANKALAADFEKAQRLIEEANERTAQASSRRSVTHCGVCEKHEARLLAISAQLLQSGQQDILLNRRPSSASTSAGSTLLNEVERENLGAILLDLENLYSTLNSSKQEHAKQAIIRALLGSDGFTGSPDFCVNPAYPIHPMQSRPSFQRTTSASSVGGANESVLRSTDQFTGKRNSRVGGRAPSPRLFKDPFFVSTQAGNAHVGTPFVVQGSALVTTRTPEDNVHSHHRKKIVRKVLSEHEALNRQRVLSSRNYFVAQGSNGSELDTKVQGLGGEDISQVPGEPEGYEDVEPVISSYVDEDGRRVYYVEVEEDEEPESAEDNTMASVEPLAPSSVLFGEQEQVTHVTPPRRFDLAIQIPSPENPSGGPIYDGTKERQLFDASDDIQQDPEVIIKLRELVNENARVREEIALSNWRILVIHFSAARDQRRLDFVNDTWRTGLASGRIRASTGSEIPSLPQSVRTSMQKLVQIRELALDDAIRARDDLRKESRRTQVHLIHSVTTVLTNLSRKNKTRVPHSDSLPLVHFEPPRTPNPTHSPSRPLYPSTRVNLSEIPRTQHVPTPSFPLRSDPSLSNQVDEPSHVKKSPTSMDRVRSNELKESLSSADELSAPSIFENDNRFPVRSLKFVPTADGDELSLMHSASSYHVHSPKHSPTKSPSKSALSVDSRSRPTHSAGPVLNSPITSSSTIDQLPQADGTASSQFVSLARRPMRPQSSPAGVRTRFRPSSASFALGEEGIEAEEIRRPQYLAQRPSSSKIHR